MLAILYICNLKQILVVAVGSYVMTHIPHRLCNEEIIGLYMDSSEL